MFGITGSFGTGLTSSNVVTSAITSVSGTNVGIVSNFNASNPASNTLSLQTQPTKNEQSINLETGSTLLSQLLNPRPSIFGTESALSVNTLVADDKSTLTFDNLSSVIKVFATDLEEQEQFFMDTAAKAQARDISLVENSEKLSDLQKAVEEDKFKQTQLSSTLDQILCQQAEIERLLNLFENQICENPPNETAIKKCNFYNGCVATDITLLKMKEHLDIINENVNEKTQTYLGDEKTNSIANIVKILNTLVWTLDSLHSTTSNLRTDAETNMKLCTAYKARLSNLRSLNSIFQ